MPLFVVKIILSTIIMKKIALLFAAFMAMAGTAAAQDHYFEFAGGGSLEPFSCTGNAGKARGTATGGNVNIRYTCFLSEHWGAFAKFGTYYAGADEHDYFGALNQADERKYLYRFNRGLYDATFSETLTIGAAYRMEFGRFSIIPSAGIGIGNLDAANFSFERRSRDGSTGPEYFSYRPVGKDVSADYLIDRYPTYKYPSPFMLSADLQLAYGMNDMVYFFIQPGFLWTPAKISLECVYTRSMQKYSPINWVEALSYADAADLWEKDLNSTTTSTDKWSIAPVFNINAGIGINIGRIIEKIR